MASSFSLSLSVCLSVCLSRSHSLCLSPLSLYTHVHVHACAGLFTYASLLWRTQEAALTSCPDAIDFDDMDADSDSALSALLMDPLCDTSSVFAEQTGRCTPGQERSGDASSPSSDTASLGHSPAPASSGADRFVLDRTASAPALLVDTNGANRFEKPPYSFPCLIGLAFKNSESGALCVREIYAYIVKHFPYFLTAKAGWKNSVRHNLSLNKYFKKVERTDGANSKSSLWTVAPMMQEQLDRDIKQCLSRVPPRTRRIQPEPGPASALAANLNSPLRRGVSQPAMAVVSSLAPGMCAPRAPEVRLASSAGMPSQQPSSPRKMHTPAVRAIGVARSPVARQLSFAGTLPTGGPVRTGAASASLAPLASSSLNPAFSSSSAASGPSTIDSLAALRASVPTPQPTPAPAASASPSLMPPLFSDDDLFSSVNLMQSIDQFLLCPGATSDLNFDILNGLFDKPW
jgi:hypothetical protein